MFLVVFLVEILLYVSMGLDANVLLGGRCVPVRWAPLGSIHPLVEISG